MIHLLLLDTILDTMEPASNPASNQTVTVIGVVAFFVIAIITAVIVVLVICLFKRYVAIIVLIKYCANGCTLKVSFQKISKVHSGIFKC